MMHDRAQHPIGAAGGCLGAVRSRFGRSRLVLPCHVSFFEEHRGSGNDDDKSGDAGECLEDGAAWFGADECEQQEAAEGDANKYHEPSLAEGSTNGPNQWC